ncbi:MAG TPA: hypothetical protein VFC16_18955 [Nakamurella sp.]|nr:hypothetical protein [Nakamurella sp.]
MRRTLYVLGLAAAVALLLRVDWSPSDAANQLSLLVLLVLSAAAGFAAPRWAWLAGLVIGACLAVAHVACRLLEMSEPNRLEPAGWAGPITLLLLVVPAMLGAYAGFAVARLVNRTA